MDREGGWVGVDKLRFDQHKVSTVQGECRLSRGIETGTGGTYRPLDGELTLIIPGRVLAGLGHLNRGDRERKGYKGEQLGKHNQYRDLRVRVLVCVFFACTRARGTIRQSVVVCEDML